MRGHERSDNDLSGTVNGAAIQAGTVHGGIHIRSAEAPASGPARSPWQLPPSIRIIDRTAEVGVLERHRTRAMLEGRPTLAVVSGLGGVGKTAVALSWLHGLRPHFPDGQLYADLRAQAPGGPADPAEVVGQFLRALGVPDLRVPGGFTEQLALYRSLTANQRLVVMLDDAATAAQVRPLLPAGRCVTAVTSRRRLPGLTVDGGQVIHLEPLAPEAAVELLDSTLADGRVAAQPEEARALVELCAGLPLAVRIAGARLAARPRHGITTMVRALTAEHDRLEALAIEGDHDVQAALDLSYQGLPAGAARLYRLLGLHPGREFGGAVGDAVLGEDASEPFDALYDANLLIDTGHGGERYRFHDLVRLHAITQANRDESAEERTAALHSIGYHYLASATRAEEVIDPQHRTLARYYGPGPVVVADFGDGSGSCAGEDAALDWLELELPNLMAVLRLARSAGVPALAWQLADAMWPLFLRRKFYPEWREAHRDGLLAAEESDDDAAVCRMLTSGGLGELDMGCHEQALEMFERAAGLFRRSGDDLGHARTLNYRGLAHQRLDQPDRAAELFGRAATQLLACGDPRAGGLARFNLAEVAVSRGRYEEALPNADAARAALQEAGDTYNTARALALTGRARLGLGQLDRAEEVLLAALGTLRSMAADHETARALGSLAQVSERRGQPELAGECYREALILYSEAGQSESAEAREACDRLRALGPGDGAGDDPAGSCPAE
ncbi:ATP-binding protein [Streptomyces sp. NBC_01435]|uniref:ATP-binding protein n=1 Tax=Streptomyces sp. NBC_01435 TaxID=2903865 RepID=UPI002E349006|nr:tetratricopeptide repeat protein [Streptomyces sp. NBC_01435]